MDERRQLVTLRSELQAQGYFTRTPGRISVELFIHVVVAIAGALIAYLADEWLLRAGGVFISGVGCLAVGTNTHSASHYAAAKRRWVNEALTFFGYSFFLGLSTTWWWHKHVAVHHPAPNVVGVDGDADLAPWLAITEEDAMAGGPAQRFYYRHVQWLVLPLLLGIVGFRMQAFGWQYVAGVLKENGARAPKARVDLACLILHYVVWLLVPALVFGVGVAVAVYVTRLVCISYGMFAVFGPGHFPVEASAVAEDQRKRDYILLQTASTINFSTGPLGRWLCGGLEYQIEHHLFPDISHPHYPAVSAHVREFCLRNGYPYRVWPWTRAILEAWRVFRDPKPVEYDLAKLRVPAVAE